MPSIKDLEQLRRKAHKAASASTPKKAPKKREKKRKTEEAKQEAGTWHPVAARPMPTSWERQLEILQSIEQADARRLHRSATDYLGYDPPDTVRQELERMQRRAAEVLPTDEGEG